MRSLGLILCAVIGMSASAVAQTPAPDAAAAPPAATIDSTATTVPPPPLAAPRLTVPPAEEVPRVPLAGYSNGSFFIRDPHDWFVIFPRGRLQVDWYNFLNRGDVPAGVESNSSADGRPKNTIFVRRARAELQGTFIGHFDFHIAGEFATTPATGSFGTVADAYVIVDYLSFLKLQVGQYDVNFTMENRTSDKYFDFMERSVAVRSFGVPSNKEIGGMLFGWLPKKVAYYSIGWYNGDGQNFRNQDNYGALVARAFVAPFAPFAGKRRWMEDIWVGASAWWQRNANLGGQVAPVLAGAQDDQPAMTTQGGVTFFGSNYGVGKDAAGNPLRAHLVPFGDTVKWAIEANVPLFRKLNLRFELVHDSIDLARYTDSVVPSAAGLKRSNGVRGGNLDGYAYYVQANYWILGDVNYLETPGLETAPRLRKFRVEPEPRWALMAAIKYEHVGFDVNNLPQVVDVSGASAPDPDQGHYSLDVVEIGLNAWATKHLRLSANYLANYIDGSAPSVTKNLFYKRWEHELLFRVGIAL